MMRRIAALGVALGAVLLPVRAQDACEPCTQARALRAEGKCKEAAPILKKAAKANKHSAEIQGLLVLCALDLGKAVDAGTALTKFLGNQPTAEQIAEVREAVAKKAAPAPSRNVILRSPDGTEPPILVFYSGAAYPPDAREFGIGGSVRLDALISVDGTAKRIEMRPDGNWATLQQLGFEEAAVSALKRWRFFPALLDGRPVESNLTVVGIFEMSE